MKTLPLIALAGWIAVNASAQTKDAETQFKSIRGGSAVADGTLSNPILPGDHPDPTIIRVGKTYWTASTAGNWAPAFSLYRSTDLHHWTAAGAVFPRVPQWADRDFWAPELVSDGGRVLVYYVGRKRGGGLCVAVATAPTPAGPYEDHGPIVCQDDGSIDPSFARDEHGKPFLIWKEDGNSQQKPTPIFAQMLTDDLLHVSGEKSLLITNDAASWEGGVVEAPYIMRHQGKFYLFYAGNACCGVSCNYAEGVARADRLLGPYQKDPDNPIIRPNGTWRCPGHGTAVQTPKGHDLFIYHAYPSRALAYLGRESLIDTITWNADGWPVVNHGNGPGATRDASAYSGNVSDNFAGKALGADWKWPFSHEPQTQVANGVLSLTLPNGEAQSFVARSLLSPVYLASVSLSSEGGLGLIGDADNGVVLSRHGSTIKLWLFEKGRRRELWKQDAIALGSLRLSVQSTTQGQAQFSYKIGKGQWVLAGPPVPLKGLLPWDSGLRVGLVVDGLAGSCAHFTRFKIADHVG